MMMMSSPIPPPPPYLPTTTATVASGQHHNNSSSSSTSVDMKQLKKALDNFKKYKYALRNCMGLASFWMIGLLIAFMVVVIDKRWTYTYAFTMAILWVPCPLAIYALIKNRPVWLLPFVMINLGGGFLYSCAQLGDAISNGTKMDVFIKCVVLLCYLYWQAIFGKVLQGMLRYPASIHKMALRMFWTIDSVKDDPVLMAELLEWQKRMKH